MLSHLLLDTDFAARQQAAALSAQLATMRDTQETLVSIVCFSLSTSVTIVFAVLLYQYFSAGRALKLTKASLLADISLAMEARSAERASELEARFSQLSQLHSHEREAVRRLVAGSLAKLQKDLRLSTLKQEFRINELAFELEITKNRGPHVALLHAIAMTKGALELKDNTRVALGLSGLRTALTQMLEPHWSEPHELQVYEITGLLSATAADHAQLGDEIRELMRRKREPDEKGSL